MVVVGGVVVLVGGGGGGDIADESFGAALFSMYV